MTKIAIEFSDRIGNEGIGIRLLDPDATLQDLLDAWQPLCDSALLYKAYAAGNHRECRNCSTNCCNTAYVIPDVIAFKRMAAHFQCTARDFITRYFDPEKVAAGLLRMKPNPCIFLQDGICSVYNLRSLICRFYLCSPLQGDTEELIYHITWTGIAALQVLAEREGWLEDSGCVTSFDRLFQNMLKEYRQHPGIEYFLRASGYHDIPLKPFLNHLSCQSQAR